MRKLQLTLLLGLAACSFDTTGVGSGDDTDASVLPPDGAVIDGLVPDIDSATIVVDAELPPVDACVAECVSTTHYRDCAAGGTLVECALGCSEVGDDHCKAVVPSNGATQTHLSGVSAVLTVATDELGVIFSDDGSIFIDEVEVRSAGTGVGPSGMGFFPLSDSIAVLAVAGLELEADSYLRVVGDRALIILSRGEVSIRGIIDIAAGCGEIDQVICGGPGAGDGAEAGVRAAAGCGAGSDGAGGGGIPEAGGGGGALGGAGGAGGDADETFVGGAGGSTAACSGATLVPLVGGSGGGTGGSTESPDGGGGGGAVQITSFISIALEGGGTIWAGGAGGGGAAGADGGGGGGSGGGILLEAPAITLHSSAVAANGGGGGDGNGGGRGEYGTLTSQPALGGGNSAEVSAGGAGGARFVTAQDGHGPGDGAGGGGGGVGIIRFNVSTIGLSVTDSVVSPAHTRGELTSE